MSAGDWPKNSNQFNAGLYSNLPSHSYPPGSQSLAGAQLRESMDASRQSSSPVSLGSFGSSSGYSSHSIKAPMALADLFGAPVVSLFVCAARSMLPRGGAADVLLLTAAFGVPAVFGYMTAKSIPNLTLKEQGVFFFGGAALSSMSVFSTLLGAAFMGPR